MSDTVIKAEGLGKKYLIGHQTERERYTALRDVMARGVKNTLQKTRQLVSGQQLVQGNSIEEFWALKDLNFEIKRGDRVGIIGRNGAGKSTLLKILSRITEPSTGRVEISGRVASLLEVGTGFHPELTGRENIFLNGAILGMSRQEIKKKFDEIVDFAEVEKFLDTPVKRYSSGMYVRLAFAVAAHLEPEILIVDEVLAVGDVEFQKKCLGKMEDVSASEGRTVIFVSHNVDAVRQLCNRGILILGGKIISNDTIKEVVDVYLGTDSIMEKEFEKKINQPCILRVFIDQNEIKLGNLLLEVEFDSPFLLSPPSVGIVISTKFGNPIFGTNARLHPAKDNKPMKKGKAVMFINNLPLHSDFYNISVFLGDTNTDYDIKIDVLNFEFKSNFNIVNNYGVNLIGPLNLKPSWVYSPL